MELPSRLNLPLMEEEEEEVSTPLMDSHMAWQLDGNKLEVGLGLGEGKRYGK